MRMLIESMYENKVQISRVVDEIMPVRGDDIYLCLRGLTAHRQGATRAHPRPEVAHPLAPLKVPKEGFKNIPTCRGDDLPHAPGTLIYLAP